MMPVYTVSVAVEATSAASAAQLVQRKVEGKSRQRTAAVIRVQDQSQRVVWRQPRKVPDGK